MQRLNIRDSDVLFPFLPAFLMVLLLLLGSVVEAARPIDIPNKRSNTVNPISMPATLAVVEDPARPFLIGQAYLLRDLYAIKSIPAINRAGDVLATVAHMKAESLRQLVEKRAVLIVVETDSLPTADGEIVVKGFAVLYVRAVNDRGEVTATFVKTREPKADHILSDFRLVKKCRNFSSCRLCNQAHM